jgi:hypothetical protein
VSTSTSAATSATERAQMGLALHAVAAQRLQDAQTGLDL